jgi:hypothetical protein
VATRADSIRRAPHRFDIPAETVPLLDPYLVAILAPMKKDIVTR